MKNDILNYNKSFKLDRPITGVIHKDRIWEQWYNQDDLKKPLPKMNQCDYLFYCNKDYMDQNIINNRGIKNVTISQLQKIVDTYASSLYTNGIRKGDIICSIGLSTPELIALKYAAAKIGAITANLNFNDAIGSIDNNKLYKQIRKIAPKMIFYLDILESKVFEVLNIPEFDDIQKICMPLTASTKIFNDERLKIFLLKEINKFKKMKINNSISFYQFKKAKINSVESVYEPGLPSNIAFTSATTGESKAVLLSHDANNALAFQHQIANLGLNRGDKNLALVPPFLAFWDADIIHMAMCLGIENILELDLSYENIPKYLLKHLPQYGIWSQFLWDSMLHMSKEEVELVKKHLKKCVVGGERAEANQVNKFEEITGILQEAGFGASEMDSCFSVAHPNCNIVGSAGIPLPFNNVRIKDQNFNDLSYNQPGRLLITGPAMMNGYYNDESLTKDVLLTDEDGTIWYDTKDYAYVDISGSLVTIDRYIEPINIVTENGNQLLQLIDISEKIKVNPNVKMCKVNSYNNNIVCHIIIDEFSSKSKQQIIDEILMLIKREFKEYEYPSIINIVDSFPRTPLGKVDYKKLTEITKNLINTYFEQICNNEKLIINENQTINNLAKTYKKHI